MIDANVLNKAVFFSFLYTKTINRKILLLKKKCNFVSSYINICLKSFKLLLPYLFNFRIMSILFRTQQFIKLNKICAENKYVKKQL